jgi:hypothetical protein
MRVMKKRRRKMKKNMKKRLSLIGNSFMNDTM